MLTDITLGQYFPGDSLLHRLDPRTKILATLLFFCGIFLADGYTSYFILIAFTVILVGSADIPAKLLARSLKPLWLLIILTVGVHIFSTPGTVVFSIGPLVATIEGIRQASFMTVRLVLLILVASLLTLTTSPIVLTDGIEHLLSPFRRIGLPAHELAMMMTIALRFIPTLLEETDRIMKAQTARGADFANGNILRRIKNMVPLLVPLFISAFRRADELAVAMEARCYRGGENRTRMKELQYSYRDAIAFLAITVLLVLLGGLRWIAH
ncbi:MAG: transporter transrane protein EcfT [Firmicutes bacterium]|nr:transporter transrane protein EcfT [Bacillota bacterium]